MQITLIFILEGYVSECGACGTNDRKYDCTATDNPKLSITKKTNIEIVVVSKKDFKGEP